MSGYEDQQRGYGGRGDGQADRGYVNELEHGRFGEMSTGEKFGTAAGGLALGGILYESYEHYEKVKRERQERGMEMPPEPTPENTRKFNGGGYGGGYGGYGGNQGRMGGDQGGFGCDDSEGFEGREQRFEGERRREDRHDERRFEEGEERRSERFEERDEGRHHHRDRDEF